MDRELLENRLSEVRKRITDDLRDLMIAEYALREAKGILRSHLKLRYDQKGVPILTVDQKLDALRYCMVHELYEDATGHLVDLLFFCGQRVVDKEEALSYIHQMIGKGSTEIKYEKLPTL